MGGFLLIYLLNPLHILHHSSRYWLLTILVSTCMYDYILYCISAVIVCVLISSVVDHGFEPWLGQSKDHIISTCCFSCMHAALRSKRKDWLAWMSNQDNVSE